MTTKLLPNFIQYGAIESPPYGQADVLEPLFQVFILDGLVTLYIQFSDSWPLHHQYDEHLSLSFQANILEETCIKQRTDDIGQRTLINNVTWLDRQVIENRTRGNPLQTFHPDIPGMKAVS